MQTLAQAIVDMDEEGAVKAAKAILAAGIDPPLAIESGLIAGMRRVGELYEREEYFVPELLLCADAMEAALAVFAPHMKAAQAKKGKIVLGTILGDTHDIGKNVVAAIVGGSGYEIIDVGRDVAPAHFIDRALETQADVIAISALMLATRENIKAVLTLLEERGLRSRFKVIIGGKPVSQEFADHIGADGYGANAAAALRLIDSLLAVK